MDSAFYSNKHGNGGIIMGTIKQNRANFITSAGKLNTSGLANDIPASNIATASLNNVNAFPPSTGQGVKQVSSDPPSPDAGQIWFNTTSKVLKQYILGDGTYASGGNMNTARQRAGSAGASQTSALIFGGFEAPPNGPPLGQTETYDGSSWTEGNDMSTTRGNTSGSGITTAAWCGAGRGTPSGPFIQNTEEYDGTSWTSGGASTTAHAAIRSCSGTQTAGLMTGGFQPPSQAPAEHNNAAEEYDGSSWTAVTSMPQYQAYNGQAGTQTATINGGGNAGPSAPSVSDNAISLEYDGTNWTAGPNINIAPAKFDAYQGAFGSQTDAVFNGGSSATTVSYNGTTATVASDMPGARPGTTSSTNSPGGNAVIMSGTPVPSIGGTSIEFTKAVAVQTITTT